MSQISFKWVLIYTLGFLVVSCVILQDNGPKMAAKIAGAEDIVASTTEIVATSEEVVIQPTQDIAVAEIAKEKPIEQSNKETVLEKPVRITIPKIGVNAKVMDVGVTSEGNLDVPPNYVDVGWYQYGPKPGEMGSAVLDGHVDNGSTLDGVFKKLRYLKDGDTITITTSNGQKLDFAVSRIDVYPTNDFPSNDIFFEGGAKMIKLITCHGGWVSKENTYDQRLVITATLK